MKEKILALLVAKFQGVRKDGLEQLARSFAIHTASEEDATALVAKLTEAQVDDYIKEYRSDVDRESTNARKTYEETLKKKFDFVEKKTTEPGGGGSDPQSDDPNGIATMVKNAIADAVKPLQTELEKYKAGDVAKSRLQNLTEKLTGCKDETFKAKALKDFGRMQFDSDEAFNEYLTETETDIATANQNTADSALAGQGKPLFAQKSESGVSSGVTQFIDSQKQESNVLSGKEV